jgi:hypothetical protein
VVGLSLRRLTQLATRLIKQIWSNHETSASYGRNLSRQRQLSISPAIIRDGLLRRAPNTITQAEFSAYMLNFQIWIKPPSAHHANLQHQGAGHEFARPIAVKTICVVVQQQERFALRKFSPFI